MIRYRSDDDSSWPPFCRAGHPLNQRHDGPLRKHVGWTPTPDGGVRTHTCLVEGCPDPVTEEAPLREEEP